MSEVPELGGEVDRQQVEAFLQRRDEAAFQVLYRRHTPFLFSLALHLSAGRGSDAEDVVQTAWIRAVESLRRFGWRSSLRTWLAGILINCAREQWRQPGLGSLPAEPESQAAGPIAFHDRIDLERAISGLPYGYREVLLLHDVEGFTHQEIAQILHIEPGTSKSQLFHARRALQQVLPQPAGAVRGGSAS